MTHIVKLVFQKLYMLPYFLCHGFVTRKPNSGKCKNRFMGLISINKQDRQCRYNVHSGVFAPPLLQRKINKYRILWVCVCSLRYPVRNAHSPYCDLWLAGSTIFFSMLFHKRHNVIKMDIKFVLRFHIRIFSETFLILRRTEPGIFKYSRWSSRKVPVILVRF